VFDCGPLQLRGFVPVHRLQKLVQFVGPDTPEPRLPDGLNPEKLRKLVLSTVEGPAMPRRMESAGAVG